MHPSSREPADLPGRSVKIYRRTVLSGSGMEEADDGLIAKFSAYLPDHPGSLAGFARTIAGAGGNIAFFHYDRSVDSNRVAVEVGLPSQARLAALLEDLEERRYAFEGERSAAEELQITSLACVLELKALLENRPGTLAAFSQLLADRGANVIYMLYDEDIDPRSAAIAMAVRDAEEIDGLLKAMNEQGYAYRLEYRGADEEAVSRVIGLKLVERFFLRLRRILPASGIEEIRSLVESSRELEQDLVRFYTEAGNHLEAGDVFETVLTFASRSRSRTGARFHCREMAPLTFAGGVELIGLRMPTSENLYLLRQGGEMTMIDAGHGIYYEDFKRYLEGRGWDPATVRRIFVSHPDTDHIGMAGYFEREFGTEVFLHPGSDDVIASRNRAGGTPGRLGDLNRYYTRLSVRFTECRFPAQPRRFPGTGREETGGFQVLDGFDVGPLSFQVLESRGGHTPGLVFYLSREAGMLFTSDFLINAESLQPDEKEHLGIYRYLLTNPNRDANLYRQETEALKRLVLALDEEIAPRGGRAVVFPGHGEYYYAGALRR